MLVYHKKAQFASHPHSPSPLIQLQPFTHLQDGQVTSYLHFIAQHQPHLIPALDTQYRMHPDIGSLVSRLFYNSTLRTAQAIASARKAAQQPKLKTLYWVDAEGSTVPVCA